MGDPRKIRKKYNSPSHPWRAERISEEHKLAQEYGLKNMTEIWRGKTFLANVAFQAKTLIALHTHQAETEKKQLIARLSALGLVQPAGVLTDVLSLTIKDVLSRRLQTQIVEKKLARTMKQARQFITHKHITVNNIVVNSPSYLVSKTEEVQISFKPSSTLASPEHPERNIEEKRSEKK